VKGMVFTEFLEMVEDKFSPDMVDQIIEASDLPSGGVYTAIGSYSYEEMLQLVTELSKQTSIPVPDLVKAFGSHLFARFSVGHAHFFGGAKNSFDFLSGIEGYIHIEVRKLYPDAQLPTFNYEVDASQPDQMTMIYRSQRPFADLAEGLIHGCIQHFHENITVSRVNLADDGTSAKFILTRVG
jgi:hypothetical protein